MPSHDALFSVNVSYERSALVLYLTGELDVATAPVLAQTVADLVNPGLSALTLDLGGVGFIDVVGLRALLGACYKATSVNATFRLCSVSDVILRVIRLARFEDLSTAVVRTVQCGSVRSESTARIPGARSA